MCLAVLKPARGVVPDEAIRWGWYNNPDGGGFAYTRNGKVQIVKGFMDVTEFLEAYRKAVRKNKESHFLLHFRIRTLGAKGPDNTHPFPIPGGALVHNGNLSGTAARGYEGPSDTKLFAERYGEAMSFDFVAAHKVGWENAIGWNKVALLYDDNRYQIINEKDGHWLDDVWYSNFSCRTQEPIGTQQGPDYDRTLGDRFL